MQYIDEKIKLIEFCSSKIVNEIYETNNNPIQKIFNNFQEVDKVLLKLKEKEIITKFLYFNKFTIHNILYNEQETIDIDIKINNNHNNINIYFYLVLLILDNNTIVNYTFSIEFIRNLNIYAIMQK